MDRVPVCRALLSVSDKRGLLELGRKLRQLGVELLSTGGTARELAAAGVAARQVSDYTGAPEILDGRVKTLHPKIHGGLLGRPTPEHAREMQEQGIEPIDLLCVNLYPFAATVAQPGVSFEAAIENIDIGGPAMIRSAAKNHERVAVLVDPDDYAEVLAELEAHAGTLTQKTRARLARRAFAHTAAYDGAIASWLEGEDAAELFPPTLLTSWPRARLLRYGENPHQPAAFYLSAGAPAREPTVAHAEILQGKELSYNNLLDLDAALELIGELEGPSCAIIKHTNPCGVGTSETGCAEAFRFAQACDPLSAFGGIVAVNRPVDEALGRALSEMFLECVIAPGYSQAALDVLGKKKQLRLLVYKGTWERGAAEQPATAVSPPLAVRSISGGLLVQARDRGGLSLKSAAVRSRRAPTDEERAALELGWRVAKHVKSNAIVLARPGQTVGIGAGQMSRVDAVKLAVVKAQLPTAGAVLASDAFFPFRDGIDEAARAGVVAVVHPGGSIRDDEVIAAADEHGMALLTTGTRHFRH